MLTEPQARRVDCINLARRLCPTADAPTLVLVADWIATGRNPSLVRGAS